MKILIHYSEQDNITHLIQIILNKYFLNKNISEIFIITTNCCIRGYHFMILSETKINDNDIKNLMKKYLIDFMKQKCDDERLNLWVKEFDHYDFESEMELKDLVIVE